MTGDRAHQREGFPSNGFAAGLAFARFCV